MTTPVLRVARPSDDLDGLLRFYRDRLGLALLYRFRGPRRVRRNHAVAGSAPYHFEFTKKRGHRAGGAPKPDNLPVFYHPDAADWRAAVQSMRDAGFTPVPSFNPYWDRQGVKTPTAIASGCKTRPGSAERRSIDLRCAASPGGWSAL